MVDERKALIGLGLMAAGFASRASAGGGSGDDGTDDGTDDSDDTDDSDGSDGTDDGGDNTNGNGDTGEVTQEYYVQPGEVQSALDDAAANGGGGVHLDPNQVYNQPSSPWQIKPDVTLYFEGARMVGDGGRSNTDFMHLHPGALVMEPHIDLYNGGNGYTPDNNYNASVFVCDTKYGEYFANGTGIRNGQIEGETDGGTGLYLRVSENKSFITHNRFELTIDNARDFRNYSSIGTAVYMETGDGLDDAWINSVHIYGHWKNPRRGVIMDGDYTAGGEADTLNQINFNKISVRYQPDNVNNTSEQMWWIQSGTWARGNIWEGMIWDLFRDDAVLIDSTYNFNDARATTENAINSPNGTDTFWNGKHIQNNSPREFFVNDTGDGSHYVY